MICLLSFLLFIPTAFCFPTGAGGCAKGIPAVLQPSANVGYNQSGYSHTAEGNGRRFMNGTLGEGGVEVAIDGKSLISGELFDIESGQNYTVSITATDEPIRGVLMRLESGSNSSGYQYDMEGTLETLSESLASALACSENGTGTVIGITHKDNSLKTSLSAVLNFYFLDTVSIDITVVMANNNTHSIFYYDGFLVRSNYPACSLCGDGKVVGNPAGEIEVNITDVNTGDNKSISCSVAETLASEGKIPPLLCLAAPKLANETCDCQYTVAPVESSTPSPVQYPTKAPSQSSSNSFDSTLLVLSLTFSVICMSLL